MGRQLQPMMLDMLLQAKQLMQAQGLMCRDRRPHKRRKGHLTTDSSDSSGEEIAAWAPVIGHYAVEIPADKKLWLNSNTKMFHLSHDENVHILLCGRRISANFHRNESQVRFEPAKCRQCFRLKDVSR